MYQAAKTDSEHFAFASADIYILKQTQRQKIHRGGTTE